MARDELSSLLAQAKPTVLKWIRESGGSSTRVVTVDGVTDHGALTGLADDDHLQYLNVGRGDARYYTQAYIDALDVHTRLHELTSALDHSLPAGASDLDVLGAEDDGAGGVQLAMLTPTYNALVSKGKILRSDASGDLWLNALHLFDDLTVDGDASVDGYINAVTALRVGSAGPPGNTLDVDGGAEISGALAVTGTSTLTGAVAAGAAVTVADTLTAAGVSIKAISSGADAGHLDFTEAGTLKWRLEYDADTERLAWRHTSQLATQAALILKPDGTIESYDAWTLRGALDVQSTIHATGAVTLDGALTVAGAVASDDYAAGTTGFQVDANGNADFRNTTVDDLTADVVMSPAGQDLHIHSDDLRIGNEAGTDKWGFGADGALVSLDPAYVSGYAGATLTPAGYLEVQDGYYRGSVRTTLFEIGSIGAFNGALMVSPSNGKLEANLAIDTSSATSYNVDITDPDTGHYQVLRVGDTVRLRGQMNVTTPTSTDGSIYPDHLFFMPTTLADDVNIGDVWLKVTAISDQTTFFRYTCDWVRGTGLGTFPAGTAVINYGANGDGFVLIDAMSQYGPYIDVVTVGSDPSVDQYPHVRVGRLDGTAMISSEQYGIIGSSDLTEANAAYFKMSNLGLKMFKSDIESHDGTNTTVRISSSGDVKLGTNVDETAGTLFHLDPAAGELTLTAKLDAGSIVSEELRVEDGGKIAFGTDGDKVRIDDSGLYMVLQPGLNNSLRLGSAATMAFTQTINSEQQVGILGTWSAGVPSVHSDLWIGNAIYGFSDISQSDNYLRFRRYYTGVKTIEMETGSFDVTVSGTMSIYGNLSHFGGTLHLGGLPTSSTGLASGTVWNDAGTLKIV